MRAVVSSIAAAMFLVCGAAPAEDLEALALETMERAVRFFTEEVSVQGSYLWTYSEDLSVRRGEGSATDTTGWVQPPGTPAVGEALLDAYEAAQDERYLEAARQTARALHDTQLNSGGWDYRIEFDPSARRRYAYRADGRSGGRNRAVFDDDTTQSALRFLMRLDKIENGAFEEARTAAEYGLAGLLRAQYPNGAWPQKYEGETWEEAKFPAADARYPESWPREYPKPRYWDFYTFNDNAMRDLVWVLVLAHRQYGNEAYLEAAERGAEFVLRAQMPEPQPAWAQQYNFAMEPAWARKFEPPSICGGESAKLMRLLVDLYLEYGRADYLEAAQKAADWFRRSQIGEDRWARFYELETNRPLYFTKAYELVYTDGDLPTHYSFQGNYGAPSALRYVDRVAAIGREAALAERDAPMSESDREKRLRDLRGRVLEIAAALDERGRWVEDGSIHCRTFNRNISTLAEYIRLSRR